ncbi:sporulation protein [Altererythrobacter soli]|uniref:Sporulation protein n=2 Tax=Croceibacterium soli TaxID=1739690 RepID=A0A6I4UT09_9SPHN|nr:sporulation protein [Croceibacterium soli]
MLLASGAALADVKAGVDAWGRGDYATAVREWEGPAAAGDADAMFNLGQAYRLGRGVTADPARAEALYARAAAAGHLQAADTYGLMLFQSGRQLAALPYIQNAAARGDPRAAYLLGVAHFNGDIVPEDWVRAYALLTLANAQGLPQAAAALAQMDQHIPLAQRQQGAGLAVELQRQADATRGRQFAAADLEMGPSVSASSGATATAGAPMAQPPLVVASPPRPPQPAASAAVSPSVAAARAAVAEASRATGTESPAEAGASYARAPAVAPQQRAAASKPQAKPAAKSGAPARPAVAASDGPWRVQLGAFSVRGNADRLWAKLRGRGELAGKSRLLVAAGGMTKLQVGGYASRESAESACRSLKRAGQECLVTR